MFTRMGQTDQTTKNHGGAEAEKLAWFFKKISNTCVVLKFKIVEL